MGVEPITKKILSDAQAEAERIRKDYESKAKRIEEAARKTSKEMEAAELERIKLEARQEHDRIVALARIDARKKLLSEKQAIIGQVLKSAEEEILKDKSYPKLLKTIIEHYAKKGDEVLLSEEDRSRFKNRLKSPKLGESVPIRGGVIIQSGRIDKNFSLDAIAESLKDELTMELAKLIFTEGGKDE
jgi:V/A-type H+-transporting ATPase subunit E